MANFDTGVSRYITAQATVINSFPVDHKGNADVCCVQCFFYRDGSRRCGLTGEISEYPTKYVGSRCPLVPMENEIGENYD